MSISIDDLVVRARRRIRRVGPQELDGLVRSGALVIDIRPIQQREIEGDLPGAIPVERNVFEWRMDPSSEYRLPQVRSHEQPIVVVCSEGFASSLAAAGLRDLGFERSCDLIGGYKAWKSWFSHHRNRFRPNVKQKVYTTGAVHDFD